MRLHRLSLAAVLAVGFALSAAAHDYQIGELHIDHPYARATTPMAQSSGGFLTITNTGTQADRLLGATSDFAARTEVHLTANDGGVMRMREVEAIDLPPGETVVFEPGGYHVMFIGIDAPFAQGETRDVTLSFERAGEITVQFTVEAMGGGHQHSDHMGHGHN